MIESPLLDAVFHHSLLQLQLQLLWAALALLGGWLVGAWLERRYMRAPDLKSALRGAARHGVGMPLVALLLVQLIRHAVPGLRHAALLKLALPLLAVWVLTRAAARMVQRVFPGNALAVYLVRTVRAVAWGALLLFLSGTTPEIIEALDAFSLHIGAERLTGWTLLQGAGSIAVTLVLALWLSSLLESRLMEAPLEVNLRLVLSRLLRASILIAGLLTALQMVGIDLTVLGVFGGALGVGLGLGLQRIAANYVSGFVILLERSLRVGDNVKVDGFQGRIYDIRTRYSIVRSTGGTEAIVPNEQLISNRIENLSYTDPNVWESTVVGVGYDTDLDAVLPLLRNVAAAVPRVLADPPCSAMLSNFGDSALEITVGFWIADPENGVLNVRSAVNLALWRALREAGVEIPFPQRVVHWTGGAPPA